MCNFITVVIALKFQGSANNVFSDTKKADDSVVSGEILPKEVISRRSVTYPPNYN